MDYAYYNSEYGVIKIGYENDFIASIKCTENINTENKPNTLSDIAFLQLCEYFKGERKSFDFKISPHGTKFQKLVWDELCNIPYGETRSYKQIAAALNNPKACRAVGTACRNNPIWIIIPCHRVVGSNGSMTGYAGGIEMKKKLLKLENVKRIY